MFAVLLAEELECSLLGLVARLDEACEGLLARRAGLLAYNTAALVHEKILLCETAAGVVRSSVVDLYAATCCEHTTLHRYDTIHLCR